MADDAQYDLLLQGTVFLDVVLTGLESPPTRGAEVLAHGMGSCPGGIANLAIAASRLGLRTTLSAAFGDDLYADFCWTTLAEQEGVDLSHSVRFPGWHSPVTVSMAFDRDRAMVTHAHPPPLPPTTMLGERPDARFGFVHLEPEPQPWVARAADDGMLLFADVGWDPVEEWSPKVLEQLGDYYAFVPNSVEAMAYTRTDDPHDAAHALSSRVPLAVVTCGGEGAIGIDSNTGEEAWVPTFPVNAHDPTGAGDVFGAALVLGTKHEWPLERRLAFANLCAALSVQNVGGSLAAPGWGDIVDWLAGVRARAEAGSVTAAETAARYRFLDEVAPSEHAAVRRASATIARISDA